MPTPDARPDDLLAAALGYAARGWRVVPLHSVDVRGCSCDKSDCGSPGKHPRTRHGLKDGTTHAEQIRQWWATWPRANVGVVCGPDSDVWMVGPDGEQGRADFAALEHGRERVEASAAAESQGGGQHYLFCWPADGKPIPNRKNHRGTKIDVRAAGDGPGYFVAAPSAGEKGRYRWLVPPNADKLLPAPAWLVEWARGTDPKPADPPARVPTPSVPQDRASVHQRVKRYLERCTPAVAGQRGHDALFWAARVTVWGYELPEHEALALLAAFYNPRCQPEWSDKELRHKVRQATSTPFDKPKGWLLQEADPVAACPPPTFPVAPKDQPKPWERAVAPNGRPTGLSATALADKDFPPPKWAVEGLLPEGLTVLGGAPKTGKSWISLLVGWAVAAGGPLDGRPVSGGEVLYLALEDTYRRLQSRLFTLRKGVDYPIPERLTLAIEWPRADADGLQHIAEWLDERKGTARLVIVDTLAKFRKVQSGKGNSYAEDYEAVGAFKKLVDHYGVCGLLVHHTRKQKSADPFDDLSGTQGISGAADTMWVLETDRTRDAQLYLDGRDLPRGTVPLTFLKDTCRWQFGAWAEGIHTNGRGDTPTTSKTKACEGWLREYLREYARPSSEIEQAAKDAGFTFTHLRDAKAKLGKNGSGEVTHHNFGKNGEKVWWSGLGPVAGWRYPPDGARPPGQWQPRADRRRDVDLPAPDDEAVV